MRKRPGLPLNPVQSNIKDMIEGYKVMAEENKLIAGEFFEAQSRVSRIDTEILLDDIGYIAGDMGNDFDDIGNLIPDF